MGATLIFPCCVPAGERYAEEARARGEPVIAASSLDYDETAPRFERWFRLPSVYEPDFAARLTEAIAQIGIARIYCPVPGAYVALERMRAEGKIAIPIVGEMPIRRHVREHRALIARAEAMVRDIAALSDGRSALDTLEVAAVLRQALAIYGEADETKIAALIAIVADAPPGDLVEIGALTGRSVAVLALLARRYDTGAVLAVDSWRASDAVQHDSPPAIRALVGAWEPGLIFESFLVSLLPIGARGRFNYLAQPSRAAHAAWARDLRVTSPEFGTVEYRGAISVLHIDANHDFASVEEDCALWLPHLAPGGWLVLDDYRWFHGDGPARVGNALLARHASEIERAFVAGNALFVKLGRTDGR
jgi:hypothetical protein